MIYEKGLGQCEEIGVKGQVSPIDYKTEKFHVFATMGSSHHSRMKIILLPKHKQNYAPSFLEKTEYATISPDDTTAAVCQPTHVIS